MKILHTADNHAGCRQYGMPEREDDFYSGFHQACIKTMNEHCDAMLVAGDLFDSSRPSARAVLEVKNGVDMLRKDGIAVLGIEGNHDLTQDCYWLRVCGIEPLDAGYEDSFNGFSATGVNYCHTDDLLERLDAIAAACEADGKRYQVVALHCGIAEMGCSFNPDASQAQLVPLLKRIGCTYCAVGHIHIPMEQVVDGIMFVQPGSTECKSVDEPHEKSVEIVELEENTGKVLSAKVEKLMNRNIELFSIETDDDVEKLRNASDKALVVAYVSSKVADGVAKAAAVLKGRDLLSRVIPVGEAGAETRSYDRGKSMDLLKDAVLAFFEEGSDQYRLVMEILSTGNPRLAVENYMNREDTK